MTGQTTLNTYRAGGAVTVLVKEPGTKEKTPWHHDQPYSPIDGADIISFWIPLDPVE